MGNESSSSGMGDASRSTYEPNAPSYPDPTTYYSMPQEPQRQNKKAARRSNQRKAGGAASSGYGRLERRGTTLPVIAERVQFFYEGRPTLQLRKRLTFDENKYEVKLGADFNLLDGRMNTTLKMQPAKQHAGVFSPTVGVHGKPVPDSVLIGFRFFTDRRSFVHVRGGWDVYDHTPILRVDVKSAQRFRPRIGGKSLAQPSPPGLEYDVRWQPHPASVVKMTVAADLPRSGNVVGHDAEPLTVSVHRLRLKQHVENNPLPQIVNAIRASFAPATSSSDDTRRSRDRERDRDRSGRREDSARTRFSTGSPSYSR
mmetsp:Transcript_2227/g.5017  ORF Transcript_2227/g.5017 Transcript_2227/m.5017 type:complete len:313 (-) Transcript_2227:88-1026(-)